MKKNKKTIITVIILLIITIISSIPIFYAHEALVEGHDLNFHLRRIEAVSENIKIGKMLPVYFNYLNHFGYGNGLFYPDLFLYIPGFLHSKGITLINSCKIFIFLINFLSVFSMYLCIKKITKDKKDGLLGAFLYGLSLYRFIDMYERGALGETLAFIFVPLVILGMYKIFYDNYNEGFYLTIGLTGLLFSHVITAYMTIFLIIVITIFNVKKLKEKQIIKTLAICLLFSIMITAFFWLPMIEQLFSDKFNIASNVAIYENIVPFIALFMDFQPIIFDIWLPPGIGLIYYLYIIIYIKNYKKNKNNTFLNHIYAIGIITIIISFSKFIWKIPIFYKVFKIIQFPWRCYSIATCLLIVGTVILIKTIKNKIIVKIGIIYTIIIFLTNCALMYINIYINNNMHDDSIMFGEYLPIELKDNYEDIVKNYTNKNIRYNYENEKLIIDIKKYQEKIEVPLIYYKGYTVKDENNIEYKVSKNDKGLVEVRIPSDIKKITVYYEGTKISKIGKYITILGITAFAIYTNYEKTKKEKNEKK